MKMFYIKPEIDVEFVEIESSFLVDSIDVPVSDEPAGKDDLDAKELFW